MQDHPHIHGEYNTRINNLEHEVGSPPHTWGILRKLDIAITEIGITPTYMGNTRSLLAGWYALRDHPHIHGEYLTIKHEVNISFGITPTYMGNTFHVMFCFCHLQDHPHIHGEYYKSIDYDVYDLRITPTYMGNTASISSPCRLTRDHPHIHGEYVIDDGAWAAASGSPPHTWGIL